MSQKFQQAGKMQRIDVQAEIQRAVKEQINRIKPNDNSSQQSGKNIAKEDIATIVQNGNVSDGTPTSCPIERRGIMRHKL